jgi:hypothetical protein
MPLTFIIDVEIVDGVIGNLLFDPDDDAVTKDTGLRTFRRADPATALLRAASRK